MKIIKSTTFSVLAICATGCATITSGTDQGIRVVTEPGITGARCSIVDSKENAAFVPHTPGTAHLTRGNGPATVTCKKQGFKPVSQPLQESLADATLGNVILGGGIGFIVDAASGAAQRYPDQVVVWMEPLEWDSEADRQRWLDEKQAHEQAARDAAKERRTEQETGDI